MVKVIGLNSGSSYADAFVAEYKHLPAQDLLATATEFGIPPRLKKPKNSQHLRMQQYTGWPRTSLKHRATRFGILGKQVQPPRLVKMQTLDVRIAI